MRLLGRLGLLLALIGAIALLWPRLNDLEWLPERAEPHPIPPDLLAFARSTPAVSLRPGQSVRYPLSVQAERDLKLIVHGELAPSASNPSGSWDLVLGLQWRDGEGSVLRRLDYHVRVRQVHYLWHGQRIGRVFYPFRAEIPTNGTVIRLRYPDLDASRELRLSLTDIDPGLLGAAVRVYQRETLPEYQLPHRWGRLSPAQQARLVKGSVYGPEYLQPRERRAFLAHRWRPIGADNPPSGGRRLLYVLDRWDLQRVPEAVPPRGFRVSASRVGVIPVPPAGGCLTVEFLDSQDTSPAGPVEVGWVDQRSEVRKRWVVDPAAHSWSDTLPAGGGWLQVRSETPRRLRVLWRDHEEITPDPARTRLYGPSGEPPLDFPLTGTSSSGRLVRLTCRQTIPAGEDVRASQPARVQIRLLDGDGVVQRTHTMNCGEEPDAYVEPTAPWAAGYTVTRAEHGYLHLTPGVAMLRVTAPRNTWVAVHTRPAGLPFRLRVPRDYQPYDPDRRRPTIWFPLRPRNLPALTRTARVLSIQAWLRPRSPRSAAADTPRHWIAVAASGPTRTRYAVEPMESREPDPSSPPVGLVAVPINEPFGAMLTSEARLPLVRPRLVFIEHRSAAVPAELLVDGEPLWSGMVSDTGALVHLPALRPGAHRFELRCPGCTGKWLMDHLDRPGPRYRLRRIHSMDPGGIEFTHRKVESREVLVGRLYLPAGASDARIRVSIRPVPPRTERLQPGWTLTEREFLITAGEPGTQPVVPPSRRPLRPAVRFFVPLNEDLPAGSYRIRMERLEDGPPGVHVALTAPIAAPPPRIQTLRIPATPRSQP